MDYKKTFIKALVRFLLIIFFSALVIVNYRPIGLKQLGLQFLGIAGILIVLYFYNRQYNKQED